MKTALGIMSQSSEAEKGQSMTHNLLLICESRIPQVSGSIFVSERLSGLECGGESMISFKSPFYSLEETMTKLDGVLKGRDITLLTKV